MTVKTTLVWEHNQWNTGDGRYHIVRPADGRYRLYDEPVPGRDVYVGEYATLGGAQQAADKHRRGPEGFERRRMTKGEMFDALLFALKDADEGELRDWCNLLFATGDRQYLHDEGEEDDGGDQEVPGGLS